MSQTPENPSKSSLLDAALGESPFKKAAQHLMLIVGGLVALVNVYKEHRALLFTGVAILAAGLGWGWLSRWWEARKPRRVEPGPSSTRKIYYFRGLLPFESGDRLLGRDADTSAVLALVGFSDFRLGFVSAEPGSGKTSLLRAALVPQLGKDGRVFVHIPDPGDDPAARIHEALARQVSVPVGPSPSLSEHFVAATQPGQKRWLVLCDQFERFFLAKRTSAERKPFFDEVKACLGEKGPPVAFLFFVRKDFVDDLLELATACEHTLDPRHYHRLRNSDPARAAAVLKEAAREERIEFGDVLLERLAEDLGRDGVVRPAEMQVVATRMHQQQIYGVAEYNEAGGARGVLAAYVRELIAPQGARTPALDREVARRLLRMLSATGVDARLLRGHTVAALAGEVERQLRADTPALLAAPGVDVSAVVRHTLRRFDELSLVVRGDEGETYNLANDYIVRPVRDAVADERTDAERANLLLDRYLDDQQRDPGLVLPWRDYRFIRANATRPFGRPEAADRLLKRTRKSLRLRAAAVALAAVVTATLLGPPQTHTTAEVHEVTHSRWVIGRQRDLAVSLTTNEGAYLWRVGTPWAAKSELPIRFEDVVISPRSTYVAGKTKEGRVYLWPSAGELRRGDPPVFEGEPAARPWLAFSPDERWACLVTRDGTLHVWDPRQPRGPGREGGLRLRGANAPRPERPPLVFFSPAGKWLAVIEDDGRLSLVRPGADGAAGGQRLLELRFPYDGTVVFSQDDAWVAAAGRSAVYCWRTATHRPAPLGPGLVLRPIGPAPRMAFSPDGKWLVVRPAQAPFTAWELGEGPRFCDTVGPAGAGSDDLSAPISFDAEGRWAVGVGPDAGVYVWRLGAAGASLKPALPGGGLPRERAPRGLFHPAGGHVVGHDQDGDVYAWRPGDLPDRARKLARFDADTIRYVFAEGHVFGVGGSVVSWGQPGEEWENLAVSPSPVTDVAVTADGKALVLFGRKHLVVVRKRFRLWGIPLWVRPWPVPTGPAD